MNAAVKAAPICLLVCLVACSSSKDDAGRDAAGGLADAIPSTDATVSRDATVPMDSEPLLDAVTFPDAEPEMDAAPADASEPDAAEMDASEPAVFTLISSAYSEGAMIPEDHACPAPDVQPALEWLNPPVGTQSYVLVLIDDTINFTHWVAFNIPAATTSLPQGASDDGLLPGGASEAQAYCRQYCGPCPQTRHTYTFRVYALDVATISFTETSPIRDADLDAAFNANTLGMATLTGTYSP
jgi:Raf kinase inhibitor-like YbhB/YbcL family protein